MSQTLCNKALQQYQSKNLSGAKKTCRRVKKSSNYFAYSSFLLGCIAKDEEHWELAITHFNKSLAAEENNSFLHWNLSEVYQHKGQYDVALKASEKSLQLADTEEAHANCFRQMGKIQLALSRHDDALANLRKAIALKPEIAINHYIYGYVLLQTHQVGDAIESIQKAIELGLVSGAAFRDLGRAFIQKNMKAEAVSALEKSIKLLGPDESATHMINALNGQQTEVPPDIYIERLFDDAADQFEKLLVDDLGYEVPAEILALLQEKSLLQGRNSHILDIGCGTGLLGKALKPYCASISGVDISQNMLNIAKEKGVYSSLSKNNIINELQVIDITAFDFIIGADVLIYMGSLISLFETLSRTNPIRQSTTFIFSLELSTTEEYQLLPSGRYAHSEFYIEKLCENYGFSIELKHDTIIRTERDKAIDGVIYFIHLK